MSREPIHINFNRLIFLDGRLACETTKESAPFFESAYHSMFPHATIQTFTPLQAAKAKKKREEEQVQVREEDVETS
jgi:hypothetical protein